jgi:hypothetical protein
MQNQKLEGEVKNKSDWGKSIKEARVRFGLLWHRRRRRRGWGRLGAI